MADKTFVQGDTAPDITASLTSEDTGDPIDLSDAEVRFQMRKADDRRYTVNAPADVIDGMAGKVGYSWGPNDLSVPGQYQVQWEVTYVDGKVETSDPPNTIEVRRQ